MRVLILGSTGMVGEGVLHECLQHPRVESVLVINRRPCEVTHPKLREILHRDFENFTPLKGDLAALDACYFCMGVSSVGMDPDKYERLTHDLTLHVAATLVEAHPGMVFCYVSGAGTDSTEEGRIRWARVKGRTENDTRKLPFKASFMFRPGYLQPTPGLKRTYRIYRLLAWMYPLLKVVARKHVSTLAELGQAMIHVALYGFEKPVLECPDIVAVAQRRP